MAGQVGNWATGAAWVGQAGWTIVCRIATVERRASKSTKVEGLQVSPSLRHGGRFGPAGPQTRQECGDLGRYLAVQAE